MFKQKKDDSDGNTNGGKRKTMLLPAISPMV
jgi:hypothetical protein